MPDNERLMRARGSLEGLSVGDALGERFFIDPDAVERLVQARAVPATDWRKDTAEANHSVWQYTDDTMMALSIVASLYRFGKIDQDWLASDFAAHFSYHRGYGPAMHLLLPRIWQGADWRAEAQSLFDGQGSFGNGAAMRIAPLGAYFADDLDSAVEHARLSAEVTHAHSEASAGAIAVAVAAAWATRCQGTSPAPYWKDFLEKIMPSVPESEVKAGIRRATDLDADTSVRQAARVLGSGNLVTAQDTVPFTLWCAARHLDDYAQALFTTISGLGDCDTNCAIVGGIVAAYTGPAGIPTDWLQAREPLPDWPFQET